MITARDVLDLVEPDHLFTTVIKPWDSGFRSDLAQKVTLYCSCRWETSRAIHDRETRDGYSTSLTQEWMDRERLQHLLDQPVQLEET